MRRRRPRVLTPAQKAAKARRAKLRRTNRPRASMKRTGQVTRARLRKSRSSKAARRTIAPGRPSEEMATRYRINRARGVKDHPAMQRAGQIKIKPRRRRKRRRRG